MLPTNPMRLSDSSKQFLLLTIIFVGASGCQFVPKASSISMPWSQEDEQKPERILAVWTDSVLHQSGQGGVRGFGGRLYFYEKENQDPVEVDGALAVYVFDADAVDLTKQKPLRKFVFTTEQFNQHMSRTSIGPSYSVWLPFGPVGEEAKRLVLITRFQGTKSGTLISHPTVKLLPGHTFEPISPKFSLTDTPPVLPASHVETKPGRTVETITLPPSFQRHLNDNSTPKAGEQTTALGKFKVPTIPLSVPQDPATSVEDGNTASVRSSPPSQKERMDRSDIRKGQWIDSPRSTDR